MSPNATELRDYFEGSNRPWQETTLGIRVDPLDESKAAVVPALPLVIVILIVIDSSIKDYDYEHEHDYEKGVRRFELPTKRRVNAV